MRFTNFNEPGIHLFMIQEPDSLAILVPDPGRICGAGEESGS
jgi:hypothetical protein